MAPITSARIVEPVTAALPGLGQRGDGRELGLVPGQCPLYLRRRLAGDDLDEDEGDGPRDPVVGLESGQREHGCRVPVGDPGGEDPDDPVGRAVAVERVAHVEPEVLCGSPAEHDLVRGGGSICGAGHDGDAEGGEVGGLDPDLDEERVGGVDPLGLEEDAHRALDARGRGDARQLPGVDVAVQEVRDPVLGHREVGLAHRQHGAGGRLEPTADDGEGDHRHDGECHGEGDSGRSGLLRPEVGGDECHHVQ
jgi:hypothetical protein